MKIPKREEERTPQAPDISRNYWALGKAAEGMRSIGKGIDEGLNKIGNDLLKIAEEKKRQTQTTEVGQFRLQAMTEWLQESDEWQKTNPDPETFMQEGMKRYQKISDRVGKSIKDPDVQMAYQQSMTMHGLDVAQHLMRQGQVRWLEKNWDERLGVVDTYLKMAGNEPDPGMARVYKGIARTEIDGMKALDQSKATELQRQKMREADQALIENNILLDAEGAKVGLEAGAFPDLNPKDISYYKNKIEERINKNSEQKDRVRIDTIALKLRQQYGNDLSAIQKKLSDIEDMKNTFGQDVDVHVISGVQGYFDRERVRMDADRSAVHHKTFQNATVLWSQNKLTETQVRNWLENDQIDARVGYSMIEALRNPTEAPRNPAAFNSLLQRIYLGVEPPQVIANDILKSNQPRSDKISLLGVAYRDEDKATDGAVRAGLQYIRGRIITRTDLIGKSLIPAEDEAAYLASQAFQQRIKEESATKKRKLTDQEISKIATEIVPIFRPKADELILRTINEKKALGERLKKWSKFKTADAVRNSKELTDEEKVMLLKEKFGFTE